MVCSRCARKIKRALDGLNGTSEVQVSLEEERVVLTYDSNALGIAKMIDVIQRSVIFPGLRRAMKRKVHPANGQDTL
jgi:copper chaperone CopZ